MCTMNKKTLILLILALFGASNLSAATLKKTVVKAGKRVVFVGDYPKWADGQKTALATEAVCTAFIAPSTYFAAKKFLELKARKEQGASLKDLMKNNKSDIALFAGSSAAALFSLLHMGAAVCEGFNTVINKYYVQPAVQQAESGKLKADNKLESEFKKALNEATVLAWGLQGYIQSLNESQRKDVLNTIKELAQSKGTPQQKNSIAKVFDDACNKYFVEVKA